MTPRQIPIAVKVRLERPEGDLVVTCEAVVSPGTPGCISGPPERCYPPEAHEIIRWTFRRADGTEIPIDELSQDDLDAADDEIGLELMDCDMDDADESDADEG